MVAQTPLVLGVDAGGTSVRALVADPSGRRLGQGGAAGANPVSRGPDEAVAQIGRAVGAALSTVDAGTVCIAVLGLAGGSTSDSALTGALDAMARQNGLTCGWTMRSDLEVAFAAASAEADGLVVVSGTGAAVGEIRGGGLVRHLDADGWLVGDVGSGFWLGLRAARAAIADREGRGEPTMLTPVVSAHFGIPAPPAGVRPGEDADVHELTSAIYRRVPVALSELAPRVSEAAAAGDAVATGLVRRAATALLDEAAVLMRDAADLRVAALAGGVLLADGPVRDEVGRGLAARFGLAVSDARDGAAGAAWCGLRLLLGDPPAAAHRRMTASE